MPRDVPSVRIGTCGWFYKDWVGPFYPKGLAPADYLPYYAEHFSIVEVDSSRLRGQRSLARAYPQFALFSVFYPGGKFAAFRPGRDGYVIVARLNSLLPAEIQRHRASCHD